MSDGPPLNARSIFDLIIAGALPASFVHRDERCVAFMDINPVTLGHVLVVPVRSVVTLAEIDVETRNHLWDIAARISAAQRLGLGSLAQHYVINDGKAASQTVPHVHLHVIPRYAGDGRRTFARMLLHLANLWVKRRVKPADRIALERTATSIKLALSQLRP